MLDTTAIIDLLSYGLADKVFGASNVEFGVTTNVLHEESIYYRSKSDDKRHSIDSAKLLSYGLKLVVMEDRTIEAGQYQDLVMNHRLGPGESESGVIAANQSYVLVTDDQFATKKLKAFYQKMNTLIQIVTLKQMMDRLTTAGRISKEINRVFDS